MFTKVHHVTYVVEDVRSMAEYLETNFGLKPEKTGENDDRKFLLYHIGPTIMDFFEPTTEDSGIARQLKEQGPGVAHVAWGVEGIDQVFQDLKGKGNELRGDAPSTSPFGYKTLNIDTKSSQGVLFQLAEGEES
jgi:methylmalonyl-CoA/ethylmalonyl-CoA epimerase